MKTRKEYKMRKRLSGLLLALSLTSVIACADNNKITKDASVLPAASRQFLTEHFAETPIAHIQIEKDFIRVDNYDVILTDGTSVEFDRSGGWKEVNRHNNTIPGAIIPEAIRNYLRSNHPNARVVVIDKDGRDCEVKLDNGMELTFDLRGNLIEID